MENDLLSVSEVARWLSKSQEWVLQHLRQIAALKLPDGDLRWRKANILDHLRAKRAA